MPINLLKHILDNQSGNTQNRDLSSFYLHDSTKGYSHGCHEVDTDLFSKLNEYRDSGNNSIEVQVSYPNKNHITNGGTKE